MIPRRAKQYCCEEISLIENYDLAVADKTRSWDCHHRLEIELGLSQKELIDMGLYWNRPASELIFLTPEEHQQLHSDGKKGGFGTRAVYQIDNITGTIIKMWKSVNNAAKSLNLSQGNISACCRGYHKTIGGFIWRYVDVH